MSSTIDRAPAAHAGSSVTVHTQPRGDRLAFAGAIMHNVDSHRADARNSYCGSGWMLAAVVCDRMLRSSCEAHVQCRQIVSELASCGHVALSSTSQSMLVGTQPSTIRAKLAGCIANLAADADIVATGRTAWTSELAVCEDLTCSSDSTAHPDFLTRLSVRTHSIWIRIILVASSRNETTSFYYVV